MTRPHHITKLDRDCELIVRPVTDDFLYGHCHGLRGCPPPKPRQGG